jgi:hypothetical protein
VSVQPKSCRDHPERQEPYDAPLQSRTRGGEYAGGKSVYQEPCCDDQECHQQARAVAASKINKRNNRQNTDSRDGVLQEVWWTQTRFVERL